MNQIKIILTQFNNLDRTGHCTMSDYGLRIYDDKTESYDDTSFDSIEDLLDQTSNANILDYIHTKYPFAINNILEWKGLYINNEWVSADDLPNVDKYKGCCYTPADDEEEESNSLVRNKIDEYESKAQQSTDVSQECSEELELSYEDFSRNDQIYSAVNECINILAEADIEHDMYIIGNLTEVIIAELLKHNIKVRYPAISQDEFGNQIRVEY